ncbi:MAG: YlxR family protein [Clostridia bacterium]|nr:YlxR family protein [Clostridia bacterium]
MAFKSVPIRTCVSCRQEFAKRDLIRVVKDKNGVVSVDETGKKEGRGAYICGSEACLAKMKKSKSLERAFGVSIPEEVYGEIAEAQIGKLK